MTAAPHDLPDHVEETLQAIERLHSAHYHGATALQRGVNRVTAIIGRPAAIGLLTLALLFWIVGNLIGSWAGYVPWDPFPFSLLQSIATVGALYVTGLILVTQRHSDELSVRREQLILQLTMQNDQKSAKIIELLEEMRRDDPLLANRVDRQAAAMSKPSDPNVVIDAIKDTVELDPTRQT